jgi:predicted phage terminase large subunit-like protein
MTKDKIVYVLHVARGQWSSYERELQMVQTAQLDAKRPGPPVLIWHEQEPGSGGKESAEATNRRMASAGFAAHFEPVTGSKESRAEPWSSQAEGGGIRLLRGGWNAPYVEEHVSFPKGKFKDQVDASDGAFGKLHTAVGEVGVRWL